VALIQ